MSYEDLIKEIDEYLAEPDIAEEMKDMDNYWIDDWEQYRGKDQLASKEFVKLANEQRDKLRKDLIFFLDLFSRQLMNREIRTDTLVTIHRIKDDIKVIEERMRKYKILSQIYEKSS